MPHTGFRLDALIRNDLGDSFIVSARTAHQEPAPANEPETIKVALSIADHPSKGRITFWILINAGANPRTISWALAVGTSSLERRMNKGSLK